MTREKRINIPVQSIIQFFENEILLFYCWHCSSITGFISSLYTDHSIIILNKGKYKREATGVYKKIYM